MPTSRFIEQTPEDLALHEEIAAEIELEKDEIRGTARAIAERLERFGSMLREARETAGLSLADLSDRTGIDAAALSRLETGRQNPTVNTLDRYAAALGKTLVIGLADNAA